MRSEHGRASEKARERAKKQKNCGMSTSAEEAALEQLLFGGVSSIHGGAKRSVSRGGDSESDSDDDLSDAKESPSGNDVDDAEDDSSEDDGRPVTVSSSSGSRASQPSKRKPAWQDEEDDKLQINISDGASRLRKLRREEDETAVTGAEFERRLRAQFTKLAPAADWAKPVQPATSDNGEGGDGMMKNVDFLRDAASIVKGGRIARGLLKVRRVKDANIADPSKAVVQSVQWHPNGSVVMTAGMDKKVRLFQLDGKANRKIQTFHLNDLPVRTAAITSDGQRIFCSGRRRHFYSIDLLTAKAQRVPRLHGCKEKSLESFVLSPDGKLLCFLGNDGYLIVAQSTTHRVICTLKMNGSVRAAAFTPDSREILSVGGDGEVYRWDLRQQMCLQRFQDEGNLGGTAIAVAPTGGVFAVGSTSGVVNVYDAATALGGGATAEEGPKPKKAVMNLTTAADFVEFNHDGSLMCVASRKKKDALKMVHVDSLTTFSNWPTSNTPLHYVNAVAFSPHSGYFGIGNDKGAVLTYRLSQFSKA